MTKAKIKKMSDFGMLLNNVLWLDKSKSTNELDKLKKMILSKTTLDFTKDELLSHWFFNDEEIPSNPYAGYDEIDDFVYTFYGDSYDAVTFISSDWNTIQALNLRINDFYDLRLEQWGDDNKTLYI